MTGTLCLSLVVLKHLPVALVILMFSFRHCTSLNDVLLSLSLWVLHRRFHYLDPTTPIHSEPTTGLV